MEAGGDGIVLRSFEERDVALVVEAGTEPLIPLITVVAACGDVDEGRAYVVRRHREVVGS